MRDFLLDHETHDLVIQDYELLPALGNEAIRQNIKQRLLLFTNEWFLNLGAGTPWIEQILVKGQVQKPVEDILKARIRETEGVAELVEFELAEAGERGLDVRFAVRTTTGDTFAQIVGVTI